MFIRTENSSPREKARSVSWNSLSKRSIIDAFFCHYRPDDDIKTEGRRRFGRHLIHFDTSFSTIPSSVMDKVHFLRESLFFPLSTRIHVTSPKTVKSHGSCCRGSENFSSFSARCKIFVLRDTAHTLTDKEIPVLQNRTSLDVAACVGADFSWHKHNEGSEKFPSPKSHVVRPRYKNLMEWNFMEYSPCCPLLWWFI